MRETSLSVDERLSRSTLTPELIDYIVQKIVQEIDPEMIILFGSYARGNFDQESDLDLLIVKDSAEPSRLIRRKVDALLWGREFPVDLLVRKPQEVAWNLRAQNPLYLHHIFKEGKVLYEKK